MKVEWVTGNSANEWGFRPVCSKIQNYTNTFCVHGATEPSHYRGFTVTLSYTPHSVGVPWTGDQPEAENSTGHNMYKW